MNKKVSTADAELTKIVKLLIITNKFSEDHQNKIHSIIQTVALTCSTTAQTLIHDGGRGEINDARHLCFYFLRQEIKLSLKSISDIFLNRTAFQNISSAIKRITNLDPKSKVDLLLINKRAQIELKLKNA